MNTVYSVRTPHGEVGRISLVDLMGGELKIANAARECHGKHEEDFDDSSVRLIKTLIRLHHMSVFEHAVMTFRITCPIFVRTHLFRYRTASPTELSGRMKQKSVEVWQPDKFRFCEDDDIMQLYRISVSTAVTTYNKMLDAGVPAEQARAVLPQGMMTTFLYTIDLRNFLHIWEERTGPGAQEETRQLVRAMAALLKQHMPVIGGEYGWLSIYEMTASGEIVKCE